ncbi:hypothetical protein SePPVgORF039 [Seal parapoxvirus]|uniref:Uncharacterized protein n=1 Tax=Seal parapoxvirus TaxID=187984 RepID=A0A1Z4CGC6_9POXV|nr:hypothetical protein CGV03_gp039 [Seal parapoxvirus]ASF89967.1 hypothetical protein SePPVgORF039 [Seal parapoxvirus]
MQGSQPFKEVFFVINIMDEKRGNVEEALKRSGASRQAFRRGKNFKRLPTGSTEPYMHQTKKTVTFAPFARSNQRDNADENAPARSLPAPDSARAQPRHSPAHGNNHQLQARPAAASPASSGVGFLERRICDDVTALTPVMMGMGEEEAGCWIELSAMVRCRKAVGFPVCRRSPQCAQTGLLTVCFESFGGMANACMRAKSASACSVSDAVVFQIVAIMYHLYQRGIFVDDVCVDVVSVPPSTITFSVSQLVFQVNTTSLAVLSPRSRLYRADLPQSCYMDVVRLLMPTGSRFYCDTCSYFFEWIIRNHLDMLSKHFVDMFRVHRRSVSGTPLHRRAEPGVLVWVFRDDAAVLGVTLTEVSISDNVRVIWSADGSVFEVDDFPVHDVFPAPELVTRARAMVCL